MAGCALGLTVFPGTARPDFVDDFDGVGLITNEYAYRNPNDPQSVFSENWVVTSGSFFRENGTAWTGHLDRGTPDSRSRTATNSEVFRVVTRRGFGDATVSLRMRIDRVADSAVDDWAGTHLFLRYVGPQEFYSVSVFRRDGLVVVKKKVPGGPDNGGTYYTLATVSHATSVGQWHDVRATVRDRDGAVELTAWIDGEETITVRDAGTGGTAITGAGKVGMRGDSTEFHVDSFTVEGR